MKKQRDDFKNKSNIEGWYDLANDWDLIEASLAKQYGIRIRQHTDMPWTEFCVLVGGIMPDTPLGQIVSIRAEKDPKVKKQFSPEQRRIHREWQTHLAKEKLKNPEQLNKDMNSLTQAMSIMFGSKEVL